MELILIVGPMKSAKSWELIGHFASLRFYKDYPFALYQPVRNTREKDDNIWSRSGLKIEAKKVETLACALESGLRIVGVDEIHMFPESEAEVVSELLKRGIKVIISGLDMDYQGKMFPIVRRLLELGPKEIKYKRAVCELCRTHDAIYTPIFQEGKQIFDGLPPVLPDDGTYEYKVACRNCFVKKVEPQAVFEKAEGES